MHDTSTIDLYLWSRYRALVHNFSFIEKVAIFSIYGTICPIMREADRHRIKTFYSVAVSLSHYRTGQPIIGRLGRLCGRESLYRSPGGYTYHSQVY